MKFRLTLLVFMIIACTSGAVFAEEPAKKVCSEWVLSDGGKRTCKAWYLEKGCESSPDGECTAVVIDEPTKRVAKCTAKNGAKCTARIKVS